MVLRRMRGRENILILTLISDIKMRLIEMFWDLAVHCGSITRFLLSTACALFFTMSTNFMVGAANGCRDILVEEIRLERVNIGRTQSVALSRPILFTWRSWQPLYMVPTGKRVSTPNRCCPLQNPTTGLPYFGVSILSPFSSSLNLFCSVNFISTVLHFCRLSTVFIAILC